MMPPMSKLSPTVQRLALVFRLQIWLLPPVSENVDRHWKLVATPATRVAASLNLPWSTSTRAFTMVAAFLTDTASVSVPVEAASAESRWVMATA